PDRGHPYPGRAGGRGRGPAPAGDGVADGLTSPARGPALPAGGSGHGRPGRRPALASPPRPVGPELLQRGAARTAPAAGAGPSVGVGIALRGTRGSRVPAAPRPDRLRRRGFRAVGPARPPTPRRRGGRAPPGRRRALRRRLPELLQRGL